MAVLVNGSEITLSGTVGDLWFEEGFASGEVIAALAEVGDDRDVTIRLNSGGGIATEGSAIHAAIARHKGKVVVVVDGIAASAASLIAIAGDELEMSLGSVLMIHDPSAVTIGDAADHEVTVRALNAMGDAFAGIYAEKTGQSIAQSRADMKAETWLTPEQAVAKGYADRVGAAPANDNAEEPPVAAFDYRIYAHAPQRLTALAKKNGWRLDAGRPLAASAAPTRQQEIPMANEPGALTPEQIDAARSAAVHEATTAASGSAAEIVDICAAAGVPTMAAALIREGVTAEQARARATAAKDIAAAVDLARKSCPAIEATAAAGFIAAGKSLAEVRASLFERITAAQAPEIGQHRQPSGGAAAGAAAATASMERILKRSGLAKGA